MTTYTFVQMINLGESEIVRHELPNDWRAMLAMRRYVQQRTMRDEYTQVSCSLSDGRRAKCSNGGNLPRLRIW